MFFDASHFCFNNYIRTKMRSTKEHVTPNTSSIVQQYNENQPMQAKTLST